MTLLTLVEIVGAFLGLAVVGVLASLAAPRSRHTLCLTERDRVACASCPRFAECRPLAAAGMP